MATDRYDQFLAKQRVRLAAWREKNREKVRRYNRRYYKNVTLPKRKAKKNGAA